MDETIDFDIVSGAGIFAPVSGTVTLEAGTGTIAVTYTAPDATGDVWHTVTIRNGFDSTSAVDFLTSVVPPFVIAEILAPVEIAVGESAPVTVSLLGFGNEAFTFEFLAGAGAFSPAAGNGTLTDGTASFASTYTAPQTTGLRAHLVRVTDSHGFRVEQFIQIDVVE